jgi:hypothetical protein
MKNMMGTASIIVLTLAMAAGQAHASDRGLCKLTGNYSDDYNSTTSIKGKKGSILNAEICPTAYTFTISDETSTGFNVKGKNKTKSCGKFSASLTFMGSCSVFGGTVTINGTPISDTFTKENTAAVHHQAPAELIEGLH